MAIDSIVFSLLVRNVIVGSYYSLYYKMHSSKIASVELPAGRPAVRDGLTSPLGMEISNLGRRYRISWR